MLFLVVNIASKSMLVLSVQFGGEIRYCLLREYKNQRRWWLR
jgi:hypothetical protein